MMETPFKLESKYSPAGDQGEAISLLEQGFKEGKKFQTLLGVTGSGKTFTMANMIQRLGKKTLILAHNKTLAAQLYAEFKEFFPHNAVEYFVSYYDYYQPEAYVPGSDTYIEKDSSVNDEIDKLRHAATRSLLEREDVIVIASVSCIYGIGSPDEYKEQRFKLFTGDKLDRDDFLRKLVAIQYERNDIDFTRGRFRVRGDLVEVFPAHEDANVIRLEFFDDELENITIVDPLRGKVIDTLTSVTIYPKSHYVVGEEKLKSAIEAIKIELRHTLQDLQAQEKLVERQRLEQRTMLDLEMLEEIGFCSGIENYSRHMTGAQPGEPPPTLIDFFGDDFLFIIDESHITCSQVGGMYKGDRARKENLVNYGFRLPSALDNRPLNFQEFESKYSKVMFVSATPGNYELEKTGGEFVEQIIRPTGLLDPVIDVRDASGQVDDFLVEAKASIKKGFRVLATTLTKKLAEELTSYYQSVGMRIRYLHSDIDTLERMEILRDLRLGEFDILVGINLLREGLDLPEVALVGIFDADKEGFLRSERSLIQTIGRAARNSEGRVILYAYKETKSMAKAISETKRRRAIQEDFNTKHGITPTTIIKSVSGGVIETLRGVKNTKKGKKAATVIEHVDLAAIDKRIIELKNEMKVASKELRFEDAAKIRDEIKELTQARLVF
ncbi:MAG: excinuclease ABC subunit B [Bdellovibrionales bacterium CG12_big_fil_rev_8_21_14_0_65_38_15]|nr:MAG: excinuclease ABC subunit B [Bdellovibrionales bacterium CG22_combo_CG10-13_8_21_14_all_38_13]PIQ56841.1 MAG: excinuclease ABC subunit B [Bdellovibrionales bacterium CG12_big_fil_rev_8_21_14_0_65_38_15]PIR29762.1 MAG: excinuclease ABC subunit B [Bdellovibrionales bacterium CG11_big_fil_rev_8_21_14_0_20_38_13]